tara:strand:- start:36 stop:362 length:327 start_codon:yes stop_codon:yes gene_type:complete
LITIFKNYLEEIVYATPKQQETQLWDIQGIIKNKSNQSFKFDLRPLNKNFSKAGSFNTKADKMVFEDSKNFILIDVKELHEKLRKTTDRVVQLNDLLNELEWNVIIKK